ncbi:26S proteasome non-ATPase regulatory subunit 13 [Schistocerca americana]|uniref:26S proteasome non-ATPase regulatory subunit 13 n=1 Tax=Schistocerca americana TaxID=7009 RepID=UPI001F4F42D8|nr:26S proteasome non-ATPase regulatory subunit 13 [Schistocerca americana]XP_047098129.1 26S proteasome non-ATPase regulatory subunit 13 [Schistocerca piceifrons]XP_049767085.1 26S proteasome non-ATPase regulatory subunit 13 [Schistocerca cancellata]XP_049839077.1 26S proteasome non-ATPase regulatory subunit 13 [Schistocerca gregaria]
MATVAVKDVSNYLSTKQREESSKEVASVWAQLEDLYNRRLWHQITLLLESFVTHDSLQKKDSLIQLYNNFIQVFENKINPLSLVEIVAHVVVQFEDKREAISFLEKIEAKVKSNNEAVALCKVLAGQILLDKLNDQDGTKKLIDEIEKMLDEEDGITTVHGRFYLLASQLYRLQGKHADYYRTALRYLGCIELSKLSREQQVQHAFFLGLAALLGEGVYNLGELLAHPVLETLRDTDKAWLAELLSAFNAGDIAQFERMKPQWSAVPDLAAEQLRLRQKISLLCLMEMTFKRAATDRQLTFEEIARETRLPIGEVELLVMKALAQGLVRGAIDQVAATVHMTWVQPRVLDKQQISSMVQRLDVWCNDVSAMETLLETRAHEFLTL